MAKVSMLKGKDPREISVERRYACLVVAANQGDLLAPALMSMMEKHHGTYLQEARTVQEIVDEYDERNRRRGLMAGVPESPL